MYTRRMTSLFKKNKKRGYALGESTRPIEPKHTEVPLLDLDQIDLTIQSHGDLSHKEFVALFTQPKTEENKHKAI